MRLCVIPARAGSKSIQHKNVAMVGGKPLIAWSLEHALASRLIDRVVVTTNCEHVAAVCEEYGVATFARSDATATDTASSESALLEVLDCFPSTSVCVFLQATSPMRRPGDIDAMIEQLVREKLDSVFAARRIEGYIWKRKRDAIDPVFEERKPRQQLRTKYYEENGSIYVFRPDVLRTWNLRMGGRIGIYEMDQLDSMQIDEPADLDLFESLMRVRGYVDDDATARL